MKRAGIASVFFIGGVILCLCAQTAGRKMYATWYKEALRLYNLEAPSHQTDSSALLLFSKCADAALLDNNPIMAAECLIKAGNIHQTYHRYSFSNEYYHRSLAVNREILKNERLQYEAYLYLGSSFYFNNIIDSAQHYFEHASLIVFNNKGQPLPEQERLYNSLGAIYFESANYLQAKNYFEKALLVTYPGADDYEESFVGINSNIANCLLRLNQFDAALRIYQSLQTYDIQKEVSGIIKQNTAHTYFQLGFYDSALAIYKQLPTVNPLNLVKALNDMGRIYMNRGEWQQSEAVFDSAIALNKKISATIKNKEEALAYLYRGQLAQRQGLTDEAIIWCNEALQEVHLNFKWVRPDDLPVDVAQTVSPITLFEILRTKTSLFYEKYKLTKRSSYLTAALQTCKKAIVSANFIKLNFDNDEAKLFFNRNYQPIYNEAIEIAYDCSLLDKKYLDEYVFILENYKGNVLYQNLQNIQLKSTAKIPDSIRKREKDIKQLLAFYTSRINNNASEKDAGQLQERLLELQVELSRLQKQYEKDEAYNLYKYQSSQSNISIATVQLAMDNETALVNYYVTENDIYILSVNKNDVALERVAADSIFYQQINLFLDEVYSYKEGTRYRGANAAAYLYRTLVAPVEKVVAGYAKWIIIPDGILYYLPIDGLVKNEHKPKYIVESTMVSYHYSFALLQQKKTHHYSEKGNRETLALAPFTDIDTNILASSLSALPFSGKEVEALGENKLIATVATKERFIEKAGRHTLIHLATHASIGADSATNWIQFYPSDSNSLKHKLFVPEIYNMDLHQAELIILSACETAGGITTSGEGLLSLSRAFLYAGSDGVISTLWKTEDQVTAYLMQQLHSNLKKNMPPEKALQQAKIDLLNNNSLSARYKTPNYWSNFIYVGKVTSTQTNKGHYWWFLMVPLIATGVLIYLKKTGSGIVTEPVL